jgi:hypothetical protein
MDLVSVRRLTPAQSGQARGAGMTARAPEGLVGWPQREPGQASRCRARVRDHLSLEWRVEGGVGSCAAATVGIRAEGPGWT